MYRRQLADTKVIAVASDKIDMDRTTAIMYELEQGTVKIRLAQPTIIRIIHRQTL